MDLPRGFRILFGAATLGILVLAGAAAPTIAQTARIQIVHNSPEPNLRQLSLYLNDIKVADSLEFRNAKPYIEVPSGIGIQAGFAPIRSTSPDDIFKTVSIDLEDGKDYVAVIIGLVDPNYPPNLDSLSTGLDLLVAETRPDAASLESSDYLVINGTPDAPSLDFKPRGRDPIASGVAYGTTPGYVTYNRYVYTMDVAPTVAPDRFFGSFDLDVGFLKDKAFTLISSGFIDTFKNGNGPGLKLLVVTSSGLVQSIGTATPGDDIATMQVINASPDVTFSTGFDVYFNGGRAINDLRFRGATPFFGVPGDATVTIELKKSDGGETFRSTTLTAEAGKNYVLMIIGVLDPSQYAPNPDGEPTELSMIVNPNARLFPSQLGVGEFIFAQAVTDAPVADMQITDLPEPITDVPFGEMTAYHAISQYDVLAELVPSQTDQPAFSRQRISIPFILGRTFVLFSSGFVRPEFNGFGPSAQLTIALPDGGVADLRFFESQTGTARVQLIHASPDPAFETADLYVDYDLRGKDATFMSGTRFVDVPAGKTVTVSLAPPESQDVVDATKGFRVQFEEGGTYSAIISGVENPGVYAPNPEGKSTALDLHVIDNVLEQGLDGTQLTVMTANEITDSPVTNVFVENAQILAQGIGFRQHGDYAIVPPLARFVDVRRSISQTRVGASYIDFTGLAARAGILVSAGFADPSANGDGPAFSTFLVLDDGSSVQAGENVVRTEDDVPEGPGTLRLQGNYPNPFKGETNLILDLPEASAVSVSLVDATGRLVHRTPSKVVPAGFGEVVPVSVENLPSGLYLYSVKIVAASGTREVHGRMMLIR